MISLTTLQDFDSIYNIINDAARRYEGVIPMDSYHTPYMSQDGLQKEIEAGVIFWGKYDEAGKLVGVMGIQSVQDVHLIRHAYVSTTQQGKGVGGELLKHLIAQTDGRIMLGAWADATWAIHFYQKHGFMLTETEEKNRLLRAYWQVPDRQIETSVVLRLR